MPEQKIFTVFYEGDDDKAFLQSMKSGGVLPAHWQIVERLKTSHPGKDGLIRQLLPFVSPINGADGNAIVLIDQDDKTSSVLFAEFRKELEQRLGAGVSIQLTTHSHVSHYSLSAGTRTGNIAVIIVGCSTEGEFVQKYGITCHSIDDWTFQLIQHEDIYAQLSEFKSIPFSMAMKKYHEVAAVFRENGLSVTKSKTYLHILRTLASINPRPATLTERIVSKAIGVKGSDAFKALIKPFYDDLLLADQLLSQAP